MPAKISKKIKALSDGSSFGLRRKRNDKSQVNEKYMYHELPSPEHSSFTEEDEADFFADSLVQPTKRSSVQFAEEIATFKEASTIRTTDRVSFVARPAVDGKPVALKPCSALKQSKYAPSVHATKRISTSNSENDFFAQDGLSPTKDIVLSKPDEVSAIADRTDMNNSLRRFALSDTGDESISEDCIENTVAGMLGRRMGQSVIGKSILATTDSLLSRSVRKLGLSSLIGRSARSESVMQKWANNSRYSFSKARVDVYSHYIAASKLGIMIENWLVPWSPSSTEALICFVFLFSLLQVIPFGVSRLLLGRFAHQFVGQYIINNIVRLFGFNPPFNGDVTGLTYGNDDQNPTRPGINFAFAFHLIAGTLWLTFSSAQVVLTNRVSRKYHKRFGYICSALFAVHCLGCLNTLYRDIVKHHPAAKIILFQDLVASVFYIGAGILCAIDGDVETHRDMMVRGYFHAIEGSGAIRFTAWVYWAAGKTFLSPALRVNFCSMACQSQFVDASAATCVFPYIFRLQGMRLVTLYFNALYLRTPEKAQDITARTFLREEIWYSFILYIQTIIGIYVISQFGEYIDFDFFRDASGKGFVLQLIALSVHTCMIVNSRLKRIKHTLLMPRRNAFRASITPKEEIHKVQEWARLMGLDESEMTPAENLLAIGQ